MPCEDEWNELQSFDADDPDVVASVEYQAALGRYNICMMPFWAGRDSHALDWDLRLMEQWQAWRELWESVIGQIDRPWPEVKNRFVEVRDKIFADVDTALIFSQRIEQAFQEAGIPLEDNETFACFVYVRERPTDVSEVIAPSVLASHPEARSLLNIIMEPETMQGLMEALEKGEYAKATAT
jgi:hypothetical protein